jgi:hypothetical protein
LKINAQTFFYPKLNSYIIVYKLKQPMKATQETMRPVWDNIEDTFLRRFDESNQMHKKGTKAYDKAKAEFFSGAMAALHAMLNSPLTNELTDSEANGLSMPAFWVLPIMSGRALKCEEKQ